MFWNRFLLVMIFRLISSIDGLDDVDLNYQQKCEIVAAHNDIRDPIYSTNMIYVTWNEQLEAAAANWANQCIFKHSSGNANGMIQYGPNDQIAEIMQRWPGTFPVPDVVTEISKNWNTPECCNEQSRTCNQNELQCQRYIQLVYWNVSQIGCALKFCPYTEIPGETTPSPNFLFVCWYRQFGIFENEFPYGVTDQGIHSLCSECPPGYQCTKNDTNYQFLCRGPGPTYCDRVPATTGTESTTTTRTVTTSVASENLSDDGLSTKWIVVIVASCIAAIAATILVGGLYCLYRRLLLQNQSHDRFTSSDATSSTYLSAFYNGAVNPNYGQEQAPTPIRKRHDSHVYEVPNGRFYEEIC